MKPEPYSREMLNAWQEIVKVLDTMIETGDTAAWPCMEHVWGPLSRSLDADGVLAQPYDSFSEERTFCSAHGRLKAAVDVNDFDVQGAAAYFLQTLKGIVLPRLRRRGQLGDTP